MGNSHPTLGAKNCYRMDPWWGQDTIIKWTPPSPGVPLYYVPLACHQGIMALNARDW